MSQDHETNGLGLWDLTDLRWIDAYDADAAPYKTPQIVKDWYKEKYVANRFNPIRCILIDIRAAALHPSSGTRTSSNLSSDKASLQRQQVRASTQPGWIPNSAAYQLTIRFIQAPLHPQPPNHPAPLPVPTNQPLPPPPLAPSQAASSAVSQPSVSSQHSSSGCFGTAAEDGRNLHLRTKMRWQILQRRTKPSYRAGSEDVKLRAGSWRGK